MDNIVIIPPNYTSTYLIIGIILFVLLLFLTWVIWKKYEADEVHQVFLTCPLGQCATNIASGDKRCSDNENVIYNPEFEVCSEKFFCTNSVLPYALLGDNSTNEFGVCENGTICKCLKNPQCAIDELVLFTSNNGSIYSNDSENMTFSQSTSGSQGSFNSIIYSNPNVQFCKLQLPFFNRLSPGTCAFNDEKNITLTEAIKCIRSNPCISGVLAFKPDNPNTFVFDLNSIYTVPLTCVVGILNPIGLSGECLLTNQIPVWNNENGELFCYNT
jgi:hypothetical protein